MCLDSTRDKALHVILTLVDGKFDIRNKPREEESKSGLVGSPLKNKLAAKIMKEVKTYRKDAHGEEHDEEKWLKI